MCIQRAMQLAYKHFICDLRKLSLLSVIKYVTYERNTVKDSTKSKQQRQAYIQNTTIDYLESPTKIHLGNSQLYDQN